LREKKVEGIFRRGKGRRPRRKKFLREELGFARSRAHGGVEHNAPEERHKAHIWQEKKPRDRRGKETHFDSAENFLARNEVERK